MISSHTKCSSRRLPAAMILLSAMSAPLSAQEILIDDFNDGTDTGWTHIYWTGNPPANPLIFDASAGYYHLATTNSVAVNGAALVLAGWADSYDPGNAPFYSEGAWRVKVRANNAGTSVALGFRGEPDCVGRGYAFELTST